MIMTSNIAKQRKRVALKPNCPNPLFEKWLKEWKFEAVSKNSTMQYCFGKALASLKKYPLCLKSGRECAILKHFGTKLCVMIDQKLAEFRREHPEVSGEDLSTQADTCTMPNVKQRQQKCSSFKDRINASPSKKSSKAVSETSSQIPTILAPGSFEVILLVDKAESHGDPKTLAELRTTTVQFEQRHLKVGDYAWVCRDRITGFEVVLPYIVERKRIDDFAKSIVDGRYHEQKFRLKRCGLPNLIYLVEGCSRVPHTMLPLATLNQAAVNTQVVDGFTIKYTPGYRESMAYLAMFTGLISQLFLSKTIAVCNKDNLPPYAIDDDLISLMTFCEFNKYAAKKRKFQVCEMFIRHLIKLHGLSVEKALTIVQHYPTPRALLAVYREGNGEKLLANITHGSLQRLLGPALSKAIHLLYTTNTLT